MTKYLRQLASESLIYGLSGVIAQFISIFLIPIYTRLLTPQDYGVMSLIATTMALTGSLAALALDSAAHRWYWDSDADDYRKSTLATWAWCHLLMALGLGILIFFFSSFLANTLVRRSDAVMYFRLAAIALPFGVLGIVSNNWFRMQRRPWGAVSFSLSINVSNILLTLLMVVGLSWGLLGVYMAQVTTAIIGTVIAIVVLKDWINPGLFQMQRLKLMLRYSWPMVPAALTSWTVNLSASYFIQFFSSTSEVGLYSVGSSLASGVALVTWAFQLAWIPFAMSIHKRDEAKAVYAHSFLVYASLLCLLGTAVSLFAPEILRILTTDAYSGASSVVAPLAFGYVMIGLASIASTGPAIVKNTRPYVVAVAMAAGLTIGLNFLLIPKFGKEGSAYASLLAQAIIPIYMFYRAQKLYPIPYRFGAAWGVFALSWVLVLIGQTWHADNVMVGIGVKLLLLTCFIPAVFILRIIPQRTMALVPVALKPGSPGV